MAMGKAVISSSVGAEGINYTNGRDILIADTPKEFHNAMKLLHTSQHKTRMIGENARKLIAHHHDSKKIISQLIQFYRKIL